MKNSVILKSFSSGISVIMNNDIPFEELLQDIAQKFIETDSFFKDASVALSLEGRNLSEEEERKILDVITENSHLNILCLMGKKDDKNIKFLALQNNLKFQDDENCGQFYRGTLSNGQSIETEHSIIILGDVNEGCSVCSSKDIVVIGSLLGDAYAGASGNKNHFVVALDMKPQKLKIGDYSYTKGFTEKKKTLFSSKVQTVPKIAYTYNGEILVEEINSELLDSFTL